MSETRDLIGIYAAIDKAVQADPDLASIVSLPLPVYGDSDPHWFDDFEQRNAEIVEGQGGNPELAIPSLDQALKGLARTEPRCRMRARRLLAVGAAARIFEKKPSKVRAAALGPRYIKAFGDEDASGERLVEQFRRDPQSEDEAAARALWWQMLLESGEIPDPDGVGPPPCSGRLVWVDLAGNPEPVPAITTEFETDIPFARARQFCDPETWTCFPCWCDMEDRGFHNGVHRYRETVSFDCQDANILRLVVDLDFIFRDEINLAVAEYRLSDVQPEQRVLVNEGLLAVLQLGPEHGSRVKVTTTKRIQFAGSLGGPGFVNVLCYIGYLGFVEDLLCCAAGEEGEEGYPDAPFPGEEPADAGTQRSMAGADPDFRGLPKFTIDQVAAATEECIDDCAEDLKTSFKKIGEGSYNADALVQDMASMWVRMLGDGVRFADIGLRSARMAPRAPRRRPQPGRSRTRDSTESSTGGKASAVGEVIEDYSELAKELIRKWSDYASDVSTKLDGGTYKADNAAADFADGVSLAIESGARLTWEAIDAVAILTGGLDKPYNPPSDEFSTHLNGAALKLKRDLKSGFGYILPRSAIVIDPPQLGPNETKFRLGVDATGQRAGLYEGTVEASTPTAAEEVTVRIIVP